MSVRIDSQDDDTVILTVGSITAHIRGDGWQDANRAAHLLGALVSATYDINDLMRKLNGLRDQAGRVSRALDAAEYEAGGLFDWLDVPMQPSSTPPEDK